MFFWDTVHTPTSNGDPSQLMFITTRHTLISQLDIETAKM